MYVGTCVCVCVYVCLCASVFITIYLCCIYIMWFRSLGIKTYKKTFYFIPFRGFFLKLWGCPTAPRLTPGLDVVSFSIFYAIQGGPTAAIPRREAENAWRLFVAFRGHIDSVHIFLEYLKEHLKKRKIFFPDICRI